MVTPKAGSTMSLISTALYYRLTIPRPLEAFRGVNGTKAAIFLMDLPGSRGGWRRSWAQSVRP